MCVLLINTVKAFNMKFLKKNNLLLIIVDVSASTGAFVGTVCLIAVRRSVTERTGCRRCGRVGESWRAQVQNGGL